MYRWYSQPVTGEELRRRRKELGLTQAQLAADLGVTVTTVARWERGERGISEPIGRLVDMLVKERIGKVRLKKGRG
ncbi:helix-turn-helix domain-containing protein [Candidatus Nitrospira bockiana]